MVAYSFQKQFAEPIIAGSKRQTIRNERVRGHASPGEPLQLYTAMRTRYCRLLGTATCLSTHPIELDFFAERVVYFGPGIITITDPDSLDEFAQSDGFADWPAMRAFWRVHHPGIEVFEGFLIRWGNLT